MISVCVCKCVQCESQHYVVLPVRTVPSKRFLRDLEHKASGHKAPKC